MQAQSISLSGSSPVFAAPSATDTVPHGSVLVVKNADVASVTVTLATTGKLETGADYPDKAYTVAAGGEAWIPVLLGAYRSAANPGVADVTFSSVTSVTAAAINRF